MELTVARIHYPIEVLGPGRRLGLWLQGCSIACQGCMSTDTWDPLSGRRLEVEALSEMIVAAHEKADLDGITITGGEPFDQPDGLEKLLRILRAAWPQADIFLYSGYHRRRLEKSHSSILGLADAVMSGPYIASRQTELPWRGSGNQELMLLSDLALERYQISQQASDARLQVGADEQSVWVAGIPRRGDLAQLRKTLESSGLVFEEVSWTP